MSSDMQTGGNKNIRLTHNAWNQLRLLKFEMQAPTYTDVFNRLFSVLEGEELPQIEDQIKAKLPQDTGTTETQKPKDKTIVVDNEVHLKLVDFKTKYLISTEMTSRGPGSISISDVVIVLIQECKPKLNQ